MSIINPYTNNPLGNYIIDNTAMSGATINTNSNQKIILNGKDSDIICDGVSLRETLSKIQERLCILQPNTDQLEKYAALRKAYEHYKLMEKLLTEKE